MKKLLIALDYDPTAQRVAETGYALAKALDARVTLLHVMSDPLYYTSAGFSPVMGFSGYIDMGPMMVDSAEQLINSSMQFLEKTREHLGDETIHTMLKEGDFAESIIEAANELNSDIIVIGSHGRKWLEKILMGSVTEKVISLTNKPLYVVPTKGN